MTIILRAHPDRTVVVDVGSAQGLLRAGMALFNTDLPRGLQEDRNLVAQMSASEWHGISLCGIASPADIEKASTLLRVAEANRNLPPSSLVILAVLDTAEAALGLAAFNRAIPRLAGFLFDGHALAQAAGVASDSALVADLRLRLPLAAKACGVPAILNVSEERPDISATAARDGYAGICMTAA